MKTLRLSDEDYQKLYEAVTIAYYYAEDAFDGHRNCDEECSKHGPLKGQLDMVNRVRDLLQPIDYEEASCKSE